MTHDPLEEILPLTEERLKAVKRSLQEIALKRRIRERISHRVKWEKIRKKRKKNKK